MKRLNLLAAFIVLSSSATAAEWTLIYVHPDGVKWYGTSAERLTDGTLRLYVKSVHPRRSPEPIAILLNCKKKQGRNYKPGEFGSEFFEPWQPIAPDSVGEIAFNAYCKK